MLNYAQLCPILQHGVFSEMAKEHAALVHLYLLSQRCHGFKRIQRGVAGFYDMWHECHWYERHVTHLSFLAVACQKLEVGLQSFCDVPQPKERFDVPSISLTWMSCTIKCCFPSLQHGITFFVHLCHGWYKRRKEAQPNFALSNFQTILWK